MKTLRAQHPVRHAANIAGSFDALASHLGVSRGAVWQWTEEGRKVPIEHCVLIEKVTEGVVRRWALRPDDWHRIWPELIGAEDAPLVPVETREVA